MVSALGPIHTRVSGPFRKLVSVYALTDQGRVEAGHVPLTANLFLTYIQIIHK